MWAFFLQTIDALIILLISVGYMGFNIGKSLICLAVIGIMGAVTHAEKAPSQDKESKSLTLNLCEESADIYGYLITMNYNCSYELNEFWDSTFSKVHKSCITKYGNTKIFNAMLSGVHQANNDLDNYQKSEICQGIYKAYKRYY